MSILRKHNTASTCRVDDTGLIEDSGRSGITRNTLAATSSDEVRADLAQAHAALAASVQDLRIATRRIAELERVDQRRRRELKHLVQREAQARVFGYHDELTGLANRRLLKDRLGQAMTRAAREKQSIALVLLDLDDFKRINDELGHSAGDQVLRIIAARLITATRGADTVCRYGGDEFVVMLPQVDDGHRADVVASKLQAAITEPIGVANCKIQLTASAGCVLYPHDAATCTELIDVADRRLYRAKALRSPVAIGFPSRRLRGQ